MTVSRRARALDALGLALVGVGATCFVIAHLGLARLHREGVVLVRRGETFGKMAEWQHWAWLWWGGLTLVAAGLGVAAYAALHHRTSTRVPHTDDAPR
jgi:hypothetical protein